jgi:uncharacterized membrane protein
MQNPPPGPPPGPPPPGYPRQPGYPQQPYQPAATGIDKRTGAFLSYLLGWVTGLIMLFVGRGDPDIKFHAAQSIVFFGGLTVIRILLGIVGSFTLGGVIFLLNTLLALFGFVIWIIVLVKAWTGGGARFQIPLVGGVVTPYAEQVADSVK